MDHRKVREAIRLIGNTFELTVLLQKRCQELVRGAEKLVDYDSPNLADIALEEVLQRKIWLSPEATVMKAPPAEPEEERPMTAEEALRIPEGEGRGSDVTIYRCPHCDYEGTSKGGLTLHLKVHEKEGPGGGPVVLAGTPAIPIPPPAPGAEQEPTGGVTIYKCPHCDYEGTSKGGLTLHLKVHEKEGAGGDGGDGAGGADAEGHFTCPDCAYVATSRGGLTLHRKTHQK